MFRQIPTLILGILFSASYSNASSDIEKSFAPEHTVQQKKYKATAVFDIDDTLCRCARPEVSTEDKNIENFFPNMTMIEWKDNEGKIYSFYFDPLMAYVIDNLVENNVRVVFFSYAVEERNKPVIENYLTQVFGQDAYDAFKKGGQFSIFSRQHMVKGAYGNCAKDLAAIGLSVEDSILIDDDSSYRAMGQELFIRLQYLDFGNFFWELGMIEERSIMDNEPMKEISYEVHFALHHGPYTLGVIHEALSVMNKENITFRKACEKVFQPYLNYPEKSPQFFLVDCIIENKEVRAFVQNMIDRGLNEIQKKFPDIKAVESFPYITANMPLTSTLPQ